MNNFLSRRFPKTVRKTTEFMKSSNKYLIRIDPWASNVENKENLNSVNNILLDMYQDLPKQERNKSDFPFEIRDSEYTFPRRIHLGLSSDGITTQRCSDNQIDITYDLVAKTIKMQKYKGGNNPIPETKIIKINDLDLQDWEKHVRQLLNFVLEFIAEDSEKMSIKIDTCKWIIETLLPNPQQSLSIGQSSNEILNVLDKE